MGLQNQPTFKMKRTTKTCHKASLIYSTVWLMHVEKLLLDLPGLETNAPIKVPGEKPIMQTQLLPEKALFILKKTYTFSFRETNVGIFYQVSYDIIDRKKVGCQVCKQKQE
jgi:hypothetical protein